MASEEQKEQARQLLAEMRAAFDSRNWGKTVSLFDKVREMKADRALRLESTCLAARALAADKQRPAARALIKSLTEDKFRKPVHYEFLARAFLDLRQYKNAALACGRADALRAEEAKAAE